jgi:hypothetical protein
MKMKFGKYIKALTVSALLGALAITVVTAKRLITNTIFFNIMC